MVATDAGDRRKATVRELQARFGMATTRQNQSLSEQTERVFKAHGWGSLRQAEQATGQVVPYSTIDRLRKGGNAAPQTLIKWARAIGESPRDWLRWGNHDPDLYLAKERTPEELAADPLLAIGRDVNVAGLSQVPHIDTGVPASTPRFRNPDEENTPPTARKMPDLTDVRTMEVIGDCLEPFLYEGDIVYVRPGRAAKPGDIVVAMLGVEGLTCKRYRIDDAGNEYLEQNDRTGRIGADRFTIVGKIVGVFRGIQDPTDTINPLAGGEQ